MGRSLRAVVASLAVAGLLGASSAAGDAGELIAFSRCRLPDSCALGADVWVMKPDATELRRLTRDGTHNDSPAWSPDGRRIAFVSGAAGIDTIWTMSADGSAMRRVTVARGLDEEPTWSPDGKRIAFVRRLSRTSQGIYAVAANGRGLRALTHVGGDYQHPSWSPDGRRICFAYARNPSRDRYAIYVINVDGSDRQKLSRDANADYRDPAWSPDGKRIAFSYLVPAGKAYAAHLEVMDAAGGHERVVLHAPANTVYFSPSWSPDGGTLVFVTLTNETRQGRIGFVNPDGRGLHRLTQLLNDNRSPDWQGRLRR